MVEQSGDVESIADPLEGWNRMMLTFNDFLYFKILKPVSQGYAWVVPEPARVSVDNFFTNLSAPVYIVNALLQGKVKDSVKEVGRFLANTTLGVGGLFDFAESQFHWKPVREDFGQTLGKWGVGNGFYLVWPIWGPSSLRDTVGKVADTAMTPLTYVPSDGSTRAGLHVFKTINKTSLTIGDYETLRKGALDPYIALRDAYRQMRDKQIAD